MNFLKKKSGFTLVEMMVVMSIVAVMSVLGISALINAQNYLVVDKAAEIFLAEIREAQNKSFSVTTEPNDTTKFPTAWVLKLEPQSVPANYEKQLTYQYVSYLNGSYSQNNYDLAREQTFSDAGFEPLRIVRKSDNADIPLLYLYYSTPFGKFFATDKTCLDSGVCSQRSDRPKNTEVVSTVDSYEIIIQYRNAIKKINIGTNGDAFISE